MRAADYKGHLGEMWRVEVETVVERPEQAATLGAWIVKAPYAHPVWHSYLICLVHLREIPGSTTKPHKKYPEAEYEVMVWALDPEKEADPDERPFRPALLTPVNLVEQFHGVSDEAAVEIIGMLAKAFTDGYANPDTDCRSRTAAILRKTIEHRVLGGHPCSHA